MTDTRNPALDGLGLTFKERMAGMVAVGAVDPREGVSRGTPLEFEVRVVIDDLDRFLRVMEHEARLEGTITFAPLGGTFPIRDGRFNLFTVEGATGRRQMTYAFSFTAADGETYALRGRKDVHDDEGLDLVEDLTTLFTVLHAGADERAPVWAAGVLRFDLLHEGLAFAASMEVTGASHWWQRAEARLAFASLAWGALRDEYLRGARLLYDTTYQNVVLSGAARGAGGVEARFFLVAGVHERGFPWGDDELFSDVLLAVSEGEGRWRRYAITDRVLDGLQVDVAGGTCRYDGPAFRLRGFSTSYSAMRAGGDELAPCRLQLQLTFDARPLESVDVAFPLVPRALRRLRSALAKELQDHLPGTHALGITIAPHEVTVREGRIRIDEEGAPLGGVLELLPAETFGEAERGAFRNVKEPTLLYGYLCALRPEIRSARVQIHSSTLRDEKVHYAKDRLDAFLGSVLARTSSSELLLQGGEVKVTALDRTRPIQKLGEPLIEVRNDHFPTAVFIRRVVRVEDPSGAACLALEEDMSRVNLAPIPLPGTKERHATVASLGGQDKVETLERVLAATGFDALARARLEASGKRREDFLVAIKPNFMFAYDRNDPSTYTDPELVHALVARLRRNGFENIKVVEAQSTYGEYFQNRGVADVARYLGYDGSAGYEVVDLTLDRAEERDLGEHLGVHPVPFTWRDADLRVSFAKNKTHCYAYYTLALKNVYGALALPNKFKEYHCGRGIYRTTIDYLAAFPVHYGLIDAWLSADGPFGIFADPRPNPTHAIVGGDDLVAVDWVGATRMGLDPRVSPYMRHAVEAFGKPRIELVGEATPYRPWLNVPVELALFTNSGLDASWHFGNVFYASFAQMDAAAFPTKPQGGFIRLLRTVTNPLRRAFFVRTGENPTPANRLFSWLFYRLGF